MKWYVLKMVFDEQHRLENAMLDTGCDYKPNSRGSIQSMPPKKNLIQQVQLASTVPALRLRVYIVAG